jgi:phage gpG-like protein
MGNIISSPAARGGIGIEIDIIPHPTIIASALGAMGDAVGKFREPLTKAIKNVVRPSIETNFEAGGRPPWAGHSGDTRTEQRGRGILILSGALMAQAGQLEDWTVDDTSAEMGLSESVWYGYVHEEGGGRNGTTPQREWALFQPEDIDNIEEIFGDWLDKQVAGALWL